MIWLARQRSRIWDWTGSRQTESADISTAHFMAGDIYHLCTKHTSRSLIIINELHWSSLTISKLDKTIDRQIPPLPSLLQSFLSTTALRIPRKCLVEPHSDALKRFHINALPHHWNRFSFLHKLVCTADNLHGELSGRYEWRKYSHASPCWGSSATLSGSTEGLLKSSCSLPIKRRFLRKKLAQGNVNGRLKPNPSVRSPIGNEAPLPRLSSWLDLYNNPHN